ncbi:MAG: hypothetical protein HYZ01_13525 [Ignavibacteriales bacterium]|nr:hypothetical protein [Ignavibacteriales bacterium]
MRITFYLCLLTLVACDSGIDSAQGPRFAIYRLKDTNLTASQIWDQPLDNLVLADNPFIGVNDLRSYKWQTHEFTVTAAVDSQLAQLRRTGPVGGIPFVVTVGNERIYLGAFWYAYSSMIAQVPYIDIILDPHRICKCQSVLVQDDKRNDVRIYRALKQVGILIE